MKSIYQRTLSSVLALAAILAVGCASDPAPADLDKLAMEITDRSFREQGIAKLDRLKQDPSNLECSTADMTGKPLPEALAKKIEEANLATVKKPADGQLIGDWRKGESIAQNGRGGTWTDSATAVNGGGCYNCHQIGKAEISFGTIGPSLYNYGKIRGVKDPADPASKAIVDYTWGKLYNSKAYNACSNMPRFGNTGLLTEAQIKDLMALLLDPKSPVNN
jgi:L-cysteine S-thiosulfotransferase